MASVNLFSLALRLIPLGLQKPRPPLGGVGRREDRDVPVDQELHPRDVALAALYDHLAAIDAEAAFPDRFLLRLLTSKPFSETFTS